MTLTAAVPHLSLVIPVYNEAETIPILAQEIETVMDGAHLLWECLWINDGSTDQTPAALGLLPEQNHRAIHLTTNVGQSAAIMVGAHHARSAWIGIIDGDGQNDPADLIRQFQLAKETQSDLIIGYRQQRQDNCIRRWSSKIANAARACMLGYVNKDAGCSTKVIRRSVLLQLPFFHGMICYIPELAQAAGYQFQEIPVNHRPRKLGQAKYGIHNRLWSGMRDLFGVRWLLSRQRKMRDFMIDNGNK